VFVACDQGSHSDDEGRLTNAVRSLPHSTENVPADRKECGCMAGWEREDGRLLPRSRLPSHGVAARCGDLFVRRRCAPGVSRERRAPATDRRSDHVNPAWSGVRIHVHDRAREYFETRLSVDHDGRSCSCLRSSGWHGSGPWGSAGGEPPRMRGVAVWRILTKRSKAAHCYFRTANDRSNARSYGRHQLRTNPPGSRRASRAPWPLE
jgi:hypothetical protein